MTKPKHAKKNISTSLERLAELRRATLIVSTCSPLRLFGSEVTNEQVEQILNKISKPFARK